jgi:hypothetical protein
MRRSATLTAAVLALGLVAATPSANAAEPTAVTAQPATKPFDGTLIAADFNYKEVVVLIGANDYGLVAPTPTRAAG